MKKHLRSVVLASLALPVFAAPAVELAEIGSGGNPQLIDRGDGSYALVFDGVQNATAFTFAGAYTVTEALVVGGGGSGGGNCGAGGGAGGLIHLENLAVDCQPGEGFTVTVGKGAPRTAKEAKGSAGDPSALTLGENTYTAFGGGGGGCWGKTAAVAGATGTGCGAGGFGSAAAGKTTMDTTIPGYFGTDGGKGQGSDKGGGGGGAGASGGAAVSGDHGGDGGDGRPIWITGREVWYAAGGGGGAADSCKRLSAGGYGGGGAGGSRQSGLRAAGKDAIGYGCGGGGGGSNDELPYGGAGSAGIVIVAVVPTQSVNTVPQFTLAVSSVTKNGARLAVTVSSLGEGATAATVFLAYGPDRDHLSAETEIGVADADGTVVEYALTELADTTGYVCAVRVVNDLEVDGNTATGEIGFTTLEDFHTTYLHGFAMRDDFTCALPFAVSGLDEGTSLANFPLLVRLSENSPAGFSYADLQRADKRDLVFIDAEGRTLPFEIDTWDPSGESLVWVTIPEFRNGTAFALCYGSEKDGVGLVRTSPWADYTGVWHLGEDGGANTVVNDSTANLITGEAWGTGTCRVDGPIGYGRKNSTNDAQNKEIRMDLTSSGREAQLAAVQALGSTFSVSFWMKLNGSCNYCCYVGRKSTHDKDATWGLVSNDGSTQSALLIYSGTTGSGNAGASVSGFSGFNGTWRKVDLIYTDTTCSIYCDGAVVWNNQTLKGGAAKQLENTNLSLGGWTEHGWGSVKGDFDEFRLRAGALSADWVATEYANENGTSFVTAGEVAVLSDEPALKTTVTEVGGNYFKVKVTVANAGLDPASVVTVFGGCAVSGSEVVLNRTFGAGLKTGESVTAVFAGLPLAGAIDYGFKAVNENATESEIVTGLVTLDASGLGGADEPVGTGGDEVKVVNGDEIHIFSTVGSGMLTLPERVTDARILVVGGGGAGGGDCGGGGGAGGYVALDGLTIALGEHAVTVGAGGTSTGKGNGGNGADSSVVIGDAVYTALGGGGGGTYKDNGSVVGLSGGSGGGSIDKTTHGSSVQHSQTGDGLGSDGGLGNGTDVGGGGGGAGSEGSANNGDVGGAGGDGKVSDITGEQVVYAAGGGGGDCQYEKGGAGGGAEVGGVRVANVGGHGGSKELTKIDDVMVDTGCGFPGRDGTGSGGGGSAGNGQGGYGGKGGSGIVVVRFPLPGSIANVTAPVVKFGERVIADGRATIPYAVQWPGKGKATCSVRFAYGLSPDRLDFTADLGAGLIGNNVVTIEGLIPNRTYYYRLTVTNGDETTVTEPQSFTVDGESAWPTEFADGLPVIADATLGALTEDEAPISGTFAKYVEGAVVTIHYSVNGVDWLESACEATADGFAGAIRNLSGKTPYTYYLTAEANGLQDRLPEETFTSPANSGAEIASALSVSAAARTVTVNGTVNDIGAAGTATVKLMIRLDGANWTQVGAKEITAAGDFSLEYAGASTLSFGTDYAVKVVIENTVGGKTYTSESALARFAAIDETVYTWKGGTGDWNDAANWTASGEGDIAGHPIVGSTARFADGAVVTVRVTRAESVARLDAAGAANVRLVGAGDSAALALGEVTGVATDFTLEDLPVTCDGDFAFGGTTAATLCLCGKRTRIVCAGRFGFAADAVADGTILFDIPWAGYDETPIQVVGAQAFPGDVSGRIMTMAVSDAARFLRHNTAGQQLLVTSAGGFDGERIAFRPVYRDYGSFTRQTTMMWIDTKPMKHGLMIRVY